MFPKNHYPLDNKLFLFWLLFYLLKYWYVSERKNIWQRHPCRATICFHTQNAAFCVLEHIVALHTHHSAQLQALSRTGELARNQQVYRNYTDTTTKYWKKLPTDLLVPFSKKWLLSLLSAYGTSVNHSACCVKLKSILTDIEVVILAIYTHFQSE